MTATTKPRYKYVEYKPGFSCRRPGEIVPSRSRHRPGQLCLWSDRGMFYVRDPERQA